MSFDGEQRELTPAEQVEMEARAIFLAAQEHGVDGYIIPAGFPGRIRNGVIFLPGNYMTVAESIFKHLDYVASTSEAPRTLVFQPVSRFRDLIQMAHTLGIELRRTGLESRVRAYLVGTQRIIFECPCEYRAPLGAGRLLGDLRESVNFGPNVIDGRNMEYLFPFPP